MKRHTMTYPWKKKQDQSGDYSKYSLEVICTCSEQSAKLTACSEQGQLTAHLYLPRTVNKVDRQPGTGID